ncbi:hypothetical protein L1887_35679 [Cichorium endivia]|nr:hypothetical protein L1887_35679 [Cichorium endivia]
MFDARVTCRVRKSKLERKKEQGKNLAVGLIRITAGEAAAAKDRGGTGSVNSPPPPSPISESIRMHLPNMGRLTGLNYMDTSRNDPDRLDRFLDVSNWESTGWDSVTERLENAPKPNSLATQEYLKTQNP